MGRILAAAILALSCGACGGGIDSYEDGLDAQYEVLEDMVDVLEGVDDEASAKAAESEIEALGGRLAAIAERLAELPTPGTEEMKELGERQAGRNAEYRERSMKQMMKLGQYPELGEAFTRAMEKGQ